jgi:hypothetical protein
LVGDDVRRRGPTLAWIVRFDDGLVGFNSNTFFNLAWCVR